MSAQHIKTWQERAAELPREQRIDERPFMRAEIADLRARIAELEGEVMRKGEDVKKWAALSKTHLMLIESLQSSERREAMLAVYARQPVEALAGYEGASCTDDDLGGTVHVYFASYPEAVAAMAAMHAATPPAASQPVGFVSPSALKALGKLAADMQNDFKTHCSMIVRPEPHALCTVPIYTTPPAAQQSEAVTDEMVERIGARLSAVCVARFRRYRGQQMTAPEQREYDKLMAFARALLAKVKA